MENSMQFQQNASVIAATGEEIGHITRIVLRPETNEVTHIVVRMKSLLKKEEKLVPIDRIVQTTESQITLHDAAEAVETMPLFEEKHFIMAGGSSPGSSPSSQSPTTFMPGGYPAYLPPSNEKYIAKVEQNIPKGTVAVKEGAKVITAEGKYVGKVERIVADLPADQATHMLVSKGLIAEEKKLIPFQWVQRMEEKEIYLGVKKESVEELAKISTEDK